MTDLAQRGSLSVGELQPPLQLGFEDAIFSGQIFMPRQQLLVYHPSDKGQDARPIHSSSTPADARLIAATNRSQRHRMVPNLRLGHGLDLAVARAWGLYISTGRGMPARGEV